MKNSGFEIYEKNHSIQTHSWRMLDVQTCLFERRLSTWAELDYWISNNFGNTRHQWLLLWFITLFFFFNFSDGGHKLFSFFGIIQWRRDLNCIDQIWTSLWWIFSIVVVSLCFCSLDSLSILYTQEIIQV